MLAFAGATHAADLQAGWYVKIGGVALFGYDPNTGRDFGIDWRFSGGLGVYGPFEVTQPTEPDPLFPQRKVLVPRTVLAVPSGTAVNMYGETEQPMPAPATDLHVVYETDYDSSQMMLWLYVEHANGQSEFLWAEARSGHHYGNTSVLPQWMTILPSDRLCFTVVAVPEPASYLSLFLGVLGCMPLMRRALW